MFVVNTSLGNIQHPSKKFDGNLHKIIFLFSVRMVLFRFGRSLLTFSKNGFLLSFISNLLQSEKFLCQADVDRTFRRETLWQKSQRNFHCCKVVIKRRPQSNHQTLCQTTNYKIHSFNWSWYGPINQRPQQNFNF